MESAGEQGFPPWWLVVAGLVIGALVGVLVWQWKKHPQGEPGGEVNFRANVEFSARPAAKGDLPSTAPDKPTG